MTPPRTVARRSVAAFAHRNYRLFFAGQTVSLIGTWMQQVAQAWLVLELSGGDPLWLGITAAAQFAPSMILGLFAGVLADVLPKRQTLIAVQFVMMILAAVLAILSAAGLVEIWMVIVLALILGVANAVDMPVRQAFAMELVGPRDVGNAVSLNSAMFNGARVIGPAVAGLTIGAFGVPAAFAINAVSFLAVIFGLALMRDRELFRGRLIPRPRSARAVVDNLAEGLRYVRETPIVLLAVTVVGLVATLGMNFNVVIPPLAADVLDADAAGFGFLMTASGVGALTAALLLVAGGRPRPIRIAIGATVLGVASIALATSSNFALSLVLMALVGAGGIGMAATANATIQLAVPDGLRGRVMSVYTTVFAGSVPIGGLLAGALAATLGVQWAIAIGGIGALIVGLVAFVWLQRIRASEVARRREARVSVETTAPASEVLPQSGAPSTNAAFRPPNPNEVLSTRR